MVVMPTETRVYTYHLTAEDKAALIRAADRDQLSLSQWVARAIKRAIASARPL